MLTEYLGSPDGEAWLNYLGQEDVLNITFGFRLERRDGTVFRAIDHDRNFTIAPGIAGVGAETYQWYLGATERSDIEMGISLEPDIFDLSGFLDSVGISKEDMRLGRYLGAIVWIFICRWDDTSFPVLPFRKGIIGEVEYEDFFTVDFRSLIDRFQQIVGHVMTVNCPFPFMGQGDGTSDRFCGVVRSPSEWQPSTSYANANPRRASERDIVKATHTGSPTGSPTMDHVWFEVAEDGGGTSGAVEPNWNDMIGNTVSDGSVTWTVVAARVVPVVITNVINSTQFQVDYIGGADAEFFKDGQVEFTGGQLDGVIEQIETFDGVTNTVTLFMPLEIAPSIGAGLNLVAGCNKTRDLCDTGSPSGICANCQYYGNVRRFGGFADMPGNNKLLGVTRNP